MSSKSYYRIKEEGALLNPMRMARVYEGVDVSKDRLDVCLRWSEPESHEEDLFFVTHDDAGIDTLVSRFLEERPVLVILEATGGFERAVAGALATEGLQVADNLCGYLLCGVGDGRTVIVR